MQGVSPAEAAKAHEKLKNVALSLEKVMKKSIFSSFCLSVKHITKKKIDSKHFFFF